MAKIKKGDLLKYKGKKWYGIVTNVDHYNEYCTVEMLDHKKWDDAEWWLDDVKLIKKRKK